MDTGAWRPLEPLEEFELFEELEPFDGLPEEPDVPPEFDTPEEVPVEGDDALFVDGADECVEPGSVAATAPATATLAKPTAAVAAFSR